MTAPNASDATSAPATDTAPETEGGDAPAKRRRRRRPRKTGTPAAG